MLQGLQNLGNTCCINTLIQCIGHCTQLRNWLLTDQPHQIQKKEEKDENKLYLSIELARIIHEMWVENKSLAPGRFLKTLYTTLDGMIQKGEQLDLGELWMLVVDKINYEIGGPTNCPPIEGNPNEEQLFITSWKKYNEKCMSMWLQTVQGWTTTRINCSLCKHETKLFEPFCSLGLDIHEAQGSFHKMFETMFQKEVIDNRTCDECKSCCEAVKFTNICMYPHVLVVHLKRFQTTPSGHMKKIADAIDIPLRLRFSGVNMTYSLSSIGNHIGNLEGGHYYAIAKNPDEKWYMYDDIQITPIEDISVVMKNNRDAYMLIYEIV